MMKKPLLLVTLTLIAVVSVDATDYLGALSFRYLTTTKGISNTQVNAIFKDSYGFVWLGTESGLDRFDGFRFKNYFFDNNNPTSIPNNTVDEIQQDYKGDIWLHTSMGYCIYNYDKEQFDREPASWMHSAGMKGTPDKVFIDSKKNMWFAVYGKGCYYYDVKTNKNFFFRAGNHQRNTIPPGEITHICETKGTVVLTYNDGTLCRVDGPHHKVLWINRYLAEINNLQDLGFKTFVDKQNNYWVQGMMVSYIYSSVRHKWYDSVGNFLSSEGISNDYGKTLIKGMNADSNSNLWIATDHNGLIIVDTRNRKTYHYLYDPIAKNGLPDNTLEYIYIDNNQGVWIGTYKNGLAYYSPMTSAFYTLPVGDICTITEDRNGNLWMGTNESGIACYNPETGQQTNYHSSQTGLGSEVVVSSLTTHDGTLYFGTFNGGMARYKNGHWKVYRQSPEPGKLCNDNVWTLMEDRNGKVIVGTLGGGIQIFDPETEQFVTYNMANSGIASDYINSLSPTTDGNILIGHSMNYSVMETATRKITNYNATKDGRKFFSPSVNAALMDSRGIIWAATASGIAMYDPANGQMQPINEINGTRGRVGCSLVEDKQGDMWLVSDHMISNVKLSKNKDGQWDFFITSYNSLDGLQSHQFNYRSVCLTKKGDVIVGGQDGINIIHPQRNTCRSNNVKVIFSGLLLFDHPLSANEEYNGRVVLEESLDRSRKLSLNSNENTFTIQLASSDVSVPARSRFLYRMGGVTDKWIMTAENQPSVTFINLMPGCYKLQVRAVNNDGSVSGDVSEMKIIIHPPFYLSIWAFLVYLIIAAVIWYYFKKRALRRQKEQLERQQQEDNMRADRELNELKLNFFTNISHELRTPITLIISPLSSMIKKESDQAKRKKLELVYRNAERLLSLVNQILDFRRMDKNQEKLNTVNGDIVGFVENVCNSFKQLANNKITLSFYSTLPSLMILFDADKMSKIISNLLSNAYKFTPDGGKIDVEMYVVLKSKSHLDEDQLEISVSDTGKGISDEDKKHVFERFFQVDGTKMQPVGGSGIGLNLVKKFVEMHDGKVKVTDNPIGGSVFIIDIPIRHAVSVEAIEKTTEFEKKDVDGQPDREAAVEMKPEMPENTSKPLVLLVDDSDDFREFMVSVLTEAYRVVEAVNGEDALARIREQRPDIILSDVMMPVMDGNEFCQTVKGNPELANIPFVMLTARLTQEQKIEGLSNGADDYITKPFSLDLLNLRIQNLIKWSKGRNTVSVDGHQTKDKSYEQPEQAEEKSVLLPDVTEISEVDQQLMDQVDRLIDANIADSDLNVESLSRELGMSRVQLYKRMVPITGSTPSEYIRSKRLEKARRILCKGELSVSEVAYRCGFNTPRYFSKYFCEMYGETPSNYKKKHTS